MLPPGSCVFKTPLPQTQPALIGQLTHAWESAANVNRAAVLNQLLRANLAVPYVFIYLLWWPSELVKKECKWNSCIKNSDEQPLTGQKESFYAVIMW